MATAIKNLDSFKIFGCFKRRFKSGQLVPPAEVETIFRTYAGNDILTVEKLKLFLNETQKEPDVTLDSAQKILEQQLKQKKVATKNKDGLTLDAFFQYLLDDNANLAHDTKVHQDMTLPTSHYFVYTGHNSYLTGNQLSSDCSEVPIINALKRGVRVIELDLWPSSKKEGEIDVLHGGTMTSPVSFEKCITAIRENAFVASPYPVVITFEDHLTPKLQAKVAEITTRVLGKYLKIPDENEKFTEFPSPDAIKKRILISTKPPKEFLGAKEKKGSSSKFEKVQFPDKAATPPLAPANKASQLHRPKEEFDWGNEVPDFDAVVENAKLDTSGVMLEVKEEAISDDEFGDGKDDDGEIEHAASPEYRRIIAIRAGKPKGSSLVDALKVDQLVKRVSLSEPQLEKVAKKHPFAIIKFTERNLLRIYPYGLRFNSSNYNPLVPWSHGAQMVAFNMQGYGRPLWLVHGFFKANGGCGYVQKPKFLFPSENGIPFDPRKELPPKVILKVRVIMGLGWLECFGKHHFDNFSPPDFYTRVGIAGVPADSRMKKTKTIEDEWLPKWGEEFEFPISVPELALLRVEVHEYDRTDTDDFGGQTCLPVSEIKSGFRCIPLLDKKGAPLNGVRLLFHLEIIDITK